MTAVILLAGCLSPYSSDFKCPKTEGGKCVSLAEAYDESLRQNNGPAGSDNQADSGKDKDGAHAADPETGYQASLYKKMQRLLDDPVTPIVVPPTAMRVLILPYPGDDHELYMPRYVFMFVDEPSWLLGDYLRGAAPAGKNAKEPIR